MHLSCLSSMQSSNELSQPPMLWEMTRVVPSVIMGFCCLVGIPGNIAVMVVISRKYQPGNFSLQLMMSLAVSDLLSLLLLPVQIYSLMSSSWALGHIACRLIYFLIYWGMHASVFSITLLSIQRYLQVLHTHCWTRLQASGQWALIGTIWALAACVSSPSLSVRNFTHSRCTVSYRCPAEQISIIVCQSMLGFVLPFVMLVCFYICLHKRMSQMVFLRTRRTTRLITNILVSFSIFWVPMHIFNLLELIALVIKSEKLLDVCNKSWDILLALTFINACLNPFLYAFAHSQLQNTVGQQNKTQPSIHITLPTPLPR